MVTDRKTTAPLSGIGSPACLLLDDFGAWISDAFGHVPYHVGSSATGKTWRDVDVRLILPDSEFAAMFPGYARAHGIDARWELMSAAVSKLAEAMTGLPVDFQFQSQAVANRFPGVRIPLHRIRSPEPPEPEDA